MSYSEWSDVFLALATLFFIVSAIIKGLVVMLHHAECGKIPKEEFNTMFFSILLSVICVLTWLSKE